jgi:hypothetical protein
VWRNTEIKKEKKKDVDGSRIVIHTINNGFDVGSLASEDNGLVDKCALAATPVILVQGRQWLVAPLVFPDPLFHGLLLGRCQVLGLCLLQTCLDRNMEAMIEDAVVC